MERALPTVIQSHRPKASKSSRLGQIEESGLPERRRRQALVGKAMLSVDDQTAADTIWMQNCDRDLLWTLSEIRRSPQTMDADRAWLEHRVRSHQKRAISPVSPVCSAAFSEKRSTPC